MDKEQHISTTLEFRMNNENVKKGKMRNSRLTFTFTKTVTTAGCNLNLPLQRVMHHPKLHLIDLLGGPCAH